MTTDRNGAAAAHPIPCIGPLAPHFDGFSALLAGKGYSASTLLNKRELVAILSRWLDRRRMPLIRLDEALLKTFHAGYRGAMQRGDVSCGRSLLSYLRSAGAILAPAQQIDRTAVGQLTRDYEHCLRSERGLVDVTVINHLRIVRRFLSAYFQERARRMQDLEPQDLHRFILQEAHRVSRCQAQITAGMLRSFVRFLRQHGLVKTDLAASIPRTRRWKLSHLPKFLAPEQIERVLKGCDRRTPKGLRDYTILLLMARLGLRAGEVVAMTLADLDWEHGEFIVRGKGQRHERLPLPKDVGTALVHYLRHGRPKCSTRRVFVCMRAPLRGLGGSSVIVHLVHEALERAGLNLSLSRLASVSTFPRDASAAPGRLLK